VVSDRISGELIEKGSELGREEEGLCRYALCPRLQADKFKITSPWNCPFVHYC